MVTIAANRAMPNIPPREALNTAELVTGLPEGHELFGVEIEVVVELIDVEPFDACEFWKRGFPNSAGAVKELRQHSVWLQNPVAQQHHVPSAQPTTLYVTDSVALSFQCQLS